MKVQLEEINKFRTMCLPSYSNQNNSAPEKKKRVRDSGGTRNVYDQIKNFKSTSLANKSSDNKNDTEPSITITIQSPPTGRGTKRKSSEHHRPESTRNEKLLKKLEEEKRLREELEEQEAERKVSVNRF